MGIAHFDKTDENYYINDVTLPETPLTLHPFQHQDLFKHIDKAKKIGRKSLSNVLNHLNFIHKPAFLHIENTQFPEAFLVPVSPDPCSEEVLILKMENDVFSILEKGKPLHLLIPDGLTVIAFPVKVQEISGCTLKITLPEKASILGKRKARRYRCRDIHVELMQDGFYAQGSLIDCSPCAFRIRVCTEVQSTFHWMNPEVPFNIHLYNAHKIVFSGPCRLIRTAARSSISEIVVAPVNDEIRRFEKKKFRSSRIKLRPAPRIHFRHPLFNGTIQRDIIDIAVNGLAVHEDNEEAVLVPGMILPDIAITLSGTETIKATAQVVYRRDSNKGYSRCGMVILDMDVRSFGKMSRVLFGVRDPHVCIDNHMDLDSLWEFFFNANFIYPKKYTSIQSYRDELRENYESLYRNNPELAVNITYEENGKIFGHISMIKAYERAWMVHHLAARKSHSRRIGLPMVKLIMNYFEGCYRFPSLKLDYWICYFQPGNTFMDYFFGEFARFLKNPRGCSVDIFAYVMHSKSSGKEPLPEGWSLEAPSPDDMRDLAQFYRNESGGLMLDAMGLNTGSHQENTIEGIYARWGFVRKCRFYSLKNGRNLAALFIVNQSSPGLNLSELLNGIKIIVVDHKEISWSIINAAMSHLDDVYTTDVVPLLIYPRGFLDDRGIPYEKTYLMLIMDIYYSKEYIEFMRTRIRQRYFYMIKYITKKLLRI